MRAHHSQTLRRRSWLRFEFVSTDIFDISILRRLAGAASVLFAEEKDHHLRLPWISIYRGYWFVCLVLFDQIAEG